MIGTISRSEAKRNATAILLAGLMCTCGSTAFYANPGSGTERLAPKRPNDVLVVFGQTVPNCTVHELGTIMYDSAQDYVSWSRSARDAINNARKRAAAIGATGIYKLQLVPAGTSSASLGIGGIAGIPVLDWAVFGQATMTQSNVAYNLISTAYACDGATVATTPVVPVPTEQSECAEGLIRNIDTGGHCCFPGQVWNVSHSQCVGIPACPKGFSANLATQSCDSLDCQPGKIRVPGELHCCWAGQSWSKLQRRCVGIPDRCPMGMQVAGEQCIGHMLCPLGMAYVPDGTSRGGFCLDIDEVTVDSYKNCVKSGRCTTPKMNPEDDYCNYKRGDRGLHPINCVTFDQAMAYCTGVGRRLPGDAEWETAASGGGQRQPYVWGQEDPERSDLCWEENRGAHSCEVGSFPKDVTVHGIHDMAGNVREWTIGPEQTRYVRGGAWNFDGKRSVRIASREANPWSSRGRIIGFRCASEHL